MMKTIWFFFLRRNHKLAIHVLDDENHEWEA